MGQTAINVASLPYLPEEIITNILKRLPVKSLLRFRCDCKRWKNLFKTPSFIQDHLNHSTHHNPSFIMGAKYFIDGFYLFSFNSKMEFHEFDIAPLISPSRYLSLVGSSNGLLCYVDDRKHPPAPFVWNPATRELIQVPCDSFSGLYVDDYFDIYFGWHFGFGFNLIINDYKIVRIRGSYEVKVYSLKTGSWRVIPFDKIDICFSDTPRHGVTVNGVMFWQGLKRCTHELRHVIVSFDLATEVFTMIGWPTFMGYSVNLAVYDDKLAIISHHRTEKSQYSIYLEVMEEGAIGSSEQRWSSIKKFIGNFDIMFCDGIIWRNQIVVCRQRGIEYMEHLYLIDVIAKECKRLDIPKPKTGLGVEFFNYVESLVPVSNNIQIEEP